MLKEIRGIWCDSCSSRGFALNLFGNVIEPQTWPRERHRSCHNRRAYEAHITDYVMTTDTEDEIWWLRKAIGREKWNLIFVNTRLHHRYNTSTQEHQARASNDFNKASIPLSRAEVRGLSALPRTPKHPLLRSADLCEPAVRAQHL